MPLAESSLPHQREFGEACLAVGEESCSIAAPGWSSTPVARLPTSPATCAARCENCAAPTRSSSRHLRFSRPSSTHADRSERLHRGAPRSLRGRAYLPDPGGVGLRLLRARQGAALSQGARRRAPARPIKESTSATTGLWLLAHLDRPQAPGARRPDLVERDFSATAPNRLWVGDLTYLRSWEGISYFAFVIDAFSRKVVGRQLASHMRPTWCWIPCGWLWGSAIKAPT